MGRGAACLVAENTALIEALLIVLDNSIQGTEQSGKKFWSRVLKSWQQVLQGETDARFKAAR